MERNESERKYLKGIVTLPVIPLRRARPRAFPIGVQELFIFARDFLPSLFHGLRLHGRMGSVYGTSDLIVITVEDEPSLPIDFKVASHSNELFTDPLRLLAVPNGSNVRC